MDSSGRRGAIGGDFVARADHRLVARPDAVSRRLGPPAPSRRGPRRRLDRRPAPAPGTRAGADARPPQRSGPRPGEPGRAGGPRHRTDRDRARRRGHLPRARPADRLPDHPSRGSGPACPAARSGAGGRAVRRRAPRSAWRPGPRDGYPGCWCGGRQPQDRGDRRPHRARRQLPRHRPERDRPTVRLRADRRLRHARRRVDLDRPRERARPPSPRSNRSRGPRRPLRPRPRERARGAAGRGPPAGWPIPSSPAPRLEEFLAGVAPPSTVGGPADGRRPVRAAPRRHHRLVGRHRRGPPVPARPLLAGGGARGRRRSLPELHPAGRRRASASARSRTTPSTSSDAQDEARELEKDPGPGGPGAGPRPPAAGGPSSLRRASIGRCRWSAATSCARCSRPCGRPSSDAAGGRPDRVPAGRPELGRPGRRPNQPPLPGPLRPAADPAPRRRGDRRGRALPDQRRASARTAGWFARSRRPARG